jgi:hypothetical protein
LIRGLTMAALLADWVHVVCMDAHRTQNVCDELNSGPSRYLAHLFRALRILPAKLFIAGRGEPCLQGRPRWAAKSNGAIKTSPMRFFSPLLFSVFWHIYGGGTHREWNGTTMRAHCRLLVVRRGLKPRRVRRLEDNQRSQKVIAAATLSSFWTSRE